MIVLLVKMVWLGINKDTYTRTNDKADCLIVSSKEDFLPVVSTEAMIHNYYMEINECIFSPA